MSTGTLRRLVCLASLALLLALPARAAPLSQGPGWGAAEQQRFYTTDQGSRLIPYRWAQALKQADGTPLLADSLARYGYIANPDGPVKGLPVGFVVGADPAGPGGGPSLGMNCSACHTRQIEAGGQVYRIDGGPALADFQSFLADLNADMGRALGSTEAFAGFARVVLNTTDPSAAAVAALRQAVQAWYDPFKLIMDISLPPAPWGVGRLDAISLIFNRVAGLDIGEDGKPIAANMAVADAPARYPFLWNASRQDLTQWPGFAPNGSPFFGLGRNTGEVLGVFARFHPQKQLFGHIDYTAGSSIRITGLWTLESLLPRIGPPRFPGAIDPALRDAGKLVFERRDGPNTPSCWDCHGVTPGGLRPPSLSTWRTPVQEVGTDSREWQVLGRTVNAGVLAGANIPLTLRRLPANGAAAADVLKTAVLGSIVQDIIPLLAFIAADKAEIAGLAPDWKQTLLSPAELLGMLQDPLDLPGPPAAGTFPYESRVLNGIWAAAPYLHNGSVPTLEDLLKPVAERPARFAVGTAYDLQRVGLARNQPSVVSSTTITTDCADRNSGNSRCGHTFGASLSAADKAALLEYLKSL